MRPSDPSTSKDMIEGLDILFKLKEMKNARKRKRGELEDQDVEDLNKIKQIQSSRVMSSNDFKVLKKIRLKVATAKAMGVNLKQWLDDNNEWESLFNIKNDNNNSDDDSQGAESVDFDAADLDTDSDDEKEPNQEDDQSGVDESDGDQSDVDQSGQEDDVSVHSGDDSIELSTDGEEDDDSDDEKQRVITGETLEHKMKMPRSQAKAMAAQNRKVKRTRYEEKFEHIAAS